MFEILYYTMSYVKEQIKIFIFHIDNQNTMCVFAFKGIYVLYFDLNVTWIYVFMLKETQFGPLEHYKD
jgi:hypothetical protein